LGENEMGRFSMNFKFNCVFNKKKKEKEDITWDKSRTLVSRIEELLCKMTIIVANLS
jgi:hypothetical protein